MTHSLLWEEEWERDQVKEVKKEVGKRRVNVCENSRPKKMPLTPSLMRPLRCFIRCLSHIKYSMQLFYKTWELFLVLQSHHQSRALHPFIHSLIKPWNVTIWRWGWKVSSWILELKARGYFSFSWCFHSSLYLQKEWVVRSMLQKCLFLSSLYVVVPTRADPVHGPERNWVLDE